MNINGKGPTLTWIFIGLAIALAIITLSMTSYGTFFTKKTMEVLVIVILQHIIILVKVPHH